MTQVWNDIRPALAALTEGSFPREAVAVAVAHREEVAPHLVDELVRLASDPSPARVGSYILHLHAAYLLAQFRDARALRPLLRLAAYDEETLDHVFGDFLTEGLDRCLASVCDGDEAPIKALMENRAASPWSRGAALGALVIRVKEGDVSREALLDYLGPLGDAEAAWLREDEEASIVFLSAIVAVAADLGVGPLLPRIRRWYADGLVDRQYIDLPSVEKQAARSVQDPSGDGHERYIRDAAMEFGAWACFQPSDARRQYDVDVNDTTYVRPAPKVGRNEPCPCGSGKKYKKCCGS